MPRARLPRLHSRRPSPLAGARIVVGLGNPGEEHARHRHNTGARALDRLSEALRLPLRDKSRMFVSGQAVTASGPIVLAQPRTYMNESGRAVQALLTVHRAAPESLIVLVDDVDLPLGRVRVRPGGGDGGQKGMRSIHQVIGSLDFPRVRIGIGRPLVDGAPSWDADAVADYVLHDPTPEEAALLAAAEERAAQAALSVLRDGVEAAMNRFNANDGETDR